MTGAAHPRLHPAGAQVCYPFQVLRPGQYLGLRERLMLLVLASGPCAYGSMKPQGIQKTINDGAGHSANAGLDYLTYVAAVYDALQDTPWTTSKMRSALRVSSKPMNVVTYLLLRTGSILKSDKVTFRSRLEASRWSTR